MSKKPPTDDVFGTFDRFFSSLFGQRVDLGSVTAFSPAHVNVSKATEARPPYRTQFNERELVMDIDLPGVSPQDVSLWATNTHVIVKGVRNPSGSFSQKYTLCADCDLRTVKASMADGQLRIRIPRVLSSEPRRVNIEHSRRGT